MLVRALDECWNACLRPEAVIGAARAWWSRRWQANIEVNVASAKLAPQNVQVDLARDDWDHEI